MREGTPSFVGKTIQTTDGTEYTLGKVMGYGAQGIVYEETSGRKVVKLYHPARTNAEELATLERLRFIRDIDLPGNFVRIEHIVTKPCMGYVMDRVRDHSPLNSYLIPDRDLPFSDWYNSGRGLRDRLFIGCLIAKAFRSLERHNLSYCDISGSNILVRIGKGASVRVIDVDNIYVAGSSSAAVLGTPRYIAPEVMSRQKNPDVLSDSYSLAVILFELLRVGHPYIGDEVIDGTPEDEDAALAGEFGYVTDQNSQNMLPSDVVFTARLRGLFERCFVKGMLNRMVRPPAHDFEVALLDASNKVVRCPSCGAWHYPRGKSRSCCPWCDAPSAPRAWLSFFECVFSEERHGSPQEKFSRNTNTYILREGKNFIKALYLSSTSESADAEDDFENVLTIAKNSKGYWVYNEFRRHGIVIERAPSRERKRIEDLEYDILRNGDRVHLGDSQPTTIGGETFRLTTIAVFHEVSR